MKRITDLAQQKGWDPENEITKADRFAGVDYTVLCLIARFLQKHRIYICVAPIYEKFSFYLHSPYGKDKATFASHNSWDAAYAAGIEMGLKQLPDKTWNSN